MIEVRSALDEIDRKLLNLLQADSRMKNTEIARRLTVTEGTIRVRMKKLQSSGIIEAFTIKLSEKVLPSRAIVKIIISGTGSTTKIAKQLKQEVGKEVHKVYEVTGGVDLYVILHSPSNEGLLKSIETIRNINTVEQTETFVIIGSI